jgi:hypothetical protein
VRGRLNAAAADQILDFWQQQEALIAEEAERRLPEVVCILRDGGAVAGVSSVFPAELQAIGGRRFWLYRNLLRADLGAYFLAMVAATYDVLADEFDGASGSPLGLCLLIGDPELRRRDRSVIWARPPMTYAGYLTDDRQVRIAYFSGARIT